MFTGRRANGGLQVLLNSAETSTSGVFDVLIVQLISSPLAAQTISGTVRGQFRWLESDIAADFFNNVLIRVASGDGTAYTGTLLDHTLGATEIAITTGTNRNTPISTALTDVTCNAGDVIVAELGYRATNTVATSYNGTLYLSNGNLTTDLPVDESATADNNSWLEFSQDLLFQPGSGANKPRDKFTELTVYVAGVANTAATLVLPSVQGMKHAITALQVYRSATAALTGNATLTINSINLPGNPSWNVGNLMAAGGTQRDINVQFGRPLISSAASTPTILSFPAPGANVLWNARASYYLVPAL